jgi:hypothetical protein
MISEHNYADAAKVIGCEINVIKTVAAVESSGAGFLPTGEVVILYEPHIFWKELKKVGKDPAAILLQVPSIHDVLYEKWKTHPYGKPSQQWERLRRAAQIDMAAAHRSASYGKFQIMGFNHQAAGYKNIFEFTHAHEQGEDRHLYAFVNLILSWGLHIALRKKDWTAFAKKYNGAAYHQNTPIVTDDYDFKLAKMYKSLA